MQVQQVNFVQNNYSQKHNPNFTAIKSVKCAGLYKKNPELANELVNAFKNNPKAMEFCKKYDVDIVFYAVKQMQDMVESSLHIFFDNVSKSKTRKFFDKLIGNNDDKIVLHAWGNNIVEADSLKASTKNLIEEVILPERKIENGFKGGILDSHIRNAEKNIQEALNLKIQKAALKKQKIESSQKTKIEFKKADSKLQNSIDDLLKKGS